MERTRSSGSARFFGVVLLACALSCGDAPPVESDCDLVGCGGWQVDIDNDEAFKLQHLPLIVYGDGLEGVFRSSYSFTSKWDVEEIWVFMGADPGDRMEFDTNLYIQGLPAILRSEHKEIDSKYDAWGESPYRVSRAGRRITIDILCNTTGVNLITPRAEGQNTSRPHWGFWFLAHAGRLPDPPSEGGFDDVFREPLQ